MLRWGIGSEFTSQCRGLASGPSVIRSGPDAKASESVPGPHLILCSDLRAGSRFLLPIPKVHLWELLLRILICNLGLQYCILHVDAATLLLTSYNYMHHLCRSLLVWYTYRSRHIRKFDTHGSSTNPKDRLCRTSVRYLNCSSTRTEARQQLILVELQLSNYSSCRTTVRQSYT